MSKKIATGVTGLDVLLEGGFIPHRAILIQGEPGAGKTTFGTQFLVNGIIENEENGLLLAMEYDVSDLISDMEKFGWPIKELTETKKLRIISPPGGLENLSKIKADDLLNLLHKEVSQHEIKRLVIDSINTLDYFLSSGEVKRRELSRFITLLRDLGCTILLTSEWSDNDNIFEYMSHGVIRLYNQKIGANRLRGLEIIKMRGINHSTMTHSININNVGGIIVHPNEIDFSST